MRKPVIRFTSTWVIALLTTALVATVTLVVTLTGQGQNVVTSRLLTASDLPAGWTVVASQSSTLDLPKSKCLSGLPTKSTANITSASVSFAERAGLPGLGEYLATGATIMSGYARSARLGDMPLADFHPEQEDDPGHDFTNFIAGGGICFGGVLVAVQRCGLPHRC